MEKTFTNAVLLSTTVALAFLVVFPPLHLWAENDVPIDESVKVHRATIDESSEAGIMSVLIENISDPVRVLVSASTTVYFGNGDEAAFDILQPGTNVYVFGRYDKDRRGIAAEKIVIRNKRITERTNPSRAEQTRQSRTIPLSALETLGLTGNN